MKTVVIRQQPTLQRNRTLSLFATADGVRAAGIRALVALASMSLFCQEAMTEVAQARGGEAMIQRGGDLYPDQPAKYNRLSNAVQKRKAVRSVNAVRLLPADDIKSTAPAISKPTKPALSKSVTPPTSKPATPALSKSALTASTKPALPTTTKPRNALKR